MEKNVQMECDFKELDNLSTCYRRNYVPPFSPKSILSGQFLSQRLTKFVIQAPEYIDRVKRWRQGPFEVLWACLPLGRVASRLDGNLLVSAWYKAVASKWAKNYWLQPWKSRLTFTTEHMLGQTVPIAYLALDPISPSYNVMTWTIARAVLQPSLSILWKAQGPS